MTCGVSCSSETMASEDEEYDDVTVSQMLSPKKHEMDATQILNNLLKEYDKKLRPDIGGEWTSLNHAFSEGTACFQRVSWCLLLVNSSPFAFSEVL